MPRTRVGIPLWRWTKCGGLAAAFAVVLGLPFLLRPEGPARAGPTRKLVIVTPHSQTIKTEFARAFAEWTAETQGYVAQIEWLDQGGTISAIKWVDDQFERSPEGIRVDLFFGGGPDPFLHFEREGLLRRCNLPPEVLAAIPQTHAGVEIYDPQQRWFGACLSGFGIVYNKAILDYLRVPEPGTWADLGAPALAGWVAAADPRQSGSMHMMFEIVLQAYGWEEGWRQLMRICANCRSFARGASDVAIQVAGGEAACGMAIDYYGFRAVARTGEDSMGFVLPEGMTVMNPDGIGVLKGAPEAEMAELFVQFVLSERGQKLWMLKAGTPGGPRYNTLFRLPVIPGMVERYRADSAVQTDPYAFKNSVDFDLQKKNQRWSILNDLIGACIIDVHGDLAKAWHALSGRPPDDPQLRKLLDPPVGEAELLRMARERWGDPAFRAETVAGWSREASARYRRLAEGR